MLAISTTITVMLASTFPFTGLHIIGYNVYPVS